MGLGLHLACGMSAKGLCRVAAHCHWCLAPCTAITQTITFHKEMRYRACAPQALRPEYDTLYRDLFKFMYDKCASVYVPEFELTWTQRPRQR